MHYDKKVRFGGWNHPDYKYVRRKLEKFHYLEMLEEMDHDLGSDSTPNLISKVQFFGGPHGQNGESSNGRTTDFDSVN